MKGSTKFWFGILFVILIYLYYKWPEEVLATAIIGGLLVGAVYFLIGFVETAVCGTDGSEYGLLKKFNIFYWILIVLQKLNKFFDKNLDI